MTSHRSRVRRRLVRKLIKTAAVLLVPLLISLLLIRPEPLAASLVHGIMLSTLVLTFLGALATQGQTRRICGGAVLAGGFYLAITTLPWVAELVVPVLPSEWLLYRAGAGVTDPTPFDRAPITNEVVEASRHWTMGRSGAWAEYASYIPLQDEEIDLLNPRRIAFHRIGHDLLALILGLVGAFLGSLYVEPDPNLKRPMPAPEAVEVVRRMMTRGHRDDERLEPE